MTPDLTLRNWLRDAEVPKMFGMKLYLASAEDFATGHVS
jgi:hypothetical protein